MSLKDYFISILNAGIFSYYLSNYSFKYYFILNITEVISITLTFFINLIFFKYLVNNEVFVYIKDNFLLPSYILAFLITFTLTIIIFQKIKKHLKRFLQLFLLIGEEKEDINYKFQKFKDFLLTINIMFANFFILFPILLLSLDFLFKTFLFLLNDIFFFNPFNLQLNCSYFEFVNTDINFFINFTKISIFIITVLFLQSSLFFHIFNAMLEHLYLPKINIVYFSSKDVLDENKFLLKENEQFPNRFFQGYQGTILIPKTVKKEMFSKTVIKEFLEYLLKTLYSYYIVLSSNSVIFRYIPIFINFIISTFYPIISIIFLNYLLHYLHCKYNFDKLTVITLGLVLFMVWYIFFLEKTLKLSYSNIFLFLSKYLHRRLINNIHMVYTSPYNEKREINVYTVLLGKGIMEKSGRNLNLVFQIISILIINIAVVVIITYFLGNFSCND